MAVTILVSSMYDVYSNLFVQENFFGKGSINRLPELLDQLREDDDHAAILIVDPYFENKRFFNDVGLNKNDIIIYAEIKDKEPTTQYIDAVMIKVKALIQNRLPCAIAGIGGGSTMDISKAISNLFTNHGQAEDYQGWDLVRNKGVFKIGIPTISGTGAEVTRTCVMTSPSKKLGMNSKYSVFDFVILDPELTFSAPQDQRFYTGMDTYIHCVESLHGRLMNAFAEAFARQSLELCREVFLDEFDHEKIMVASYLGGISVATTMVGVIHPISAGLSKVLGFRHGIANCIVFNVAHEYYDEVEEFHRILDHNKITLPKITASNDEIEKMIDETHNHNKPLWNALGDDWQKILNRDVLFEIYKRMM